ncbi:hypothetical protein FH608_045975 [Nonomuraea phyllanthi]|uniref:Uncharacterized protein n=1 Tax=Nonomuraea phyllanthi TaxID=2219224 RepID=A0A5C4V766_9ACTN|nr:hypothetical protein [Nonomuraea phyllanthi]KAB8186845.1 hypothetical protein FH608_045975 [Nonomuraea phyllanthi]
MFISKFAATVAAGVLVATGLATSATAAAPFRDSVQISNNLDSGTHGPWAWDLLRRSVTITKTIEGANNAPDTYRVVLSDSGAFTTIKGAKSPQAGVTISRAVTGSFSGSYTFTVTSTSAPSAAGVDNSYDYGCSIGGSCTKPAETSAWPKLYFNDPQAEVTPNHDWQWTYRTCAETWRNADPAVGGNSGDITGAHCDAQVTALAPTVTQPDCGTTRGELVIPAKKGVRYEVRGKAWRAGTFKVRPGSYRVVAVAKDGYVLRGDRRWRLTVDEAKACPTPTATPTVTVSPTPTGDPDDREATPKSPTLTQATCDDKTASVSIPEVPGVVYKTSSGKTVEQGKTYSVDPGSVTITAEAADGYTLADGAESEWTLVLSEAPTDCPTATPTTTTHVTVVNNIPVPARVDTGLGGLAK